MGPAYKSSKIGQLKHHSTLPVLDEKHPGLILHKHQLNDTSSRQPLAQAGETLVEHGQFNPAKLLPSPYNKRVTL